MPLFVCENCGVIENTALCNYWSRKIKLCSQCDPKINKWHNKFEREFNTMDKEGNLNAKEQAKVNKDANRDAAYAVNNNALSVDDLTDDFDVSLLSEKKQEEFAESRKTKETGTTKKKEPVKTETEKK